MSHILNLFNSIFYTPYYFEYHWYCEDKIKCAKYCKTQSSVFHIYEMNY